MNGRERRALEKEQKRVEKQLERIKQKQQEHAFLCEVLALLNVSSMEDALWEIKELKKRANATRLPFVQIGMETL